MKKQYWIHRITGGANAAQVARKLLFDESYISIGWSELSNNCNLNKIKDDQLESLMEEVGWGCPRNRHNLKRFVRKMQKGDIVVVPLPYTFTICEIIEDEIFTNESLQSEICKDAIKEDKYYYFQTRNGEWIDLGFYRKVKILAKDISRYDYADSELIKKLKIRQTNSNITIIKESVDNAINAFKAKRPINIKELFFNEAIPTLFNIISKKLTPEKLESLVEWYLKALGANVDTPSKNESTTEDGDADKVAFFESIKTVIMVQVKKHSGETNEWAVQQIKAFKQNHNYGDYHTQMWIISTCDEFNEEATTMAEDAGIRLINGKEFCRMILNNGLENLEL